MKSTFFILCLAFFFSFTSCSNDGSELPACVDTKLMEFRNDDATCVGSGDLTTWNFRGETVYCFNAGICIADGTADIYDAECNLLCQLGGVSGNVTCDGVPWETNATFIETIYEH